MRPQRRDLDWTRYVRLRSEGSLLELRHFEEWRKGCLHSPLCFKPELLEAFSTERAVFKLTTVSLFGKPFSTVPTLHYSCNAHTFYFTSLWTCPKSSLVPSRDLRATMITKPPRVAIVRSVNMSGVMTVQMDPGKFRTAMLRTFMVTCSDIAVYRASIPIRYGSLA